MEQWKLPISWGWINLGELCDLVGGGTPSRANAKYFDGDIVWVTPTDIPSTTLIPEIADSKTKLTREGLRHSSARLVPVGTVLFSSRATIGKIAIASVPLATNQGFANFLCSENIHNHYLAWALRLFTEEIKRLATSAVYLEISKAKLREFSIPIPFPNNPAYSLEIQRRIVLRLESLLAEVRSARELQEKIEEETNLLIDSIMKEVFASRGEWQNEKPLGELVSIDASLVDPREPEYANLPHIYGASIEGGTGRLLDYNTAAEDGMKSSKYLFEPVVVLYSKIRPYLRKVTIADFRGVCSADMYPLTVTSEELMPEFLMWTLLSPEFTEFINNFSLRARIPKVNREQLMAYRVRYPDPNNQKKIAAYIQNWREEVSEMQRAQKENTELLAKTEESFLAQAFRGEL